MRVMVLVKATGESEAGILPTSDEIEAMGAFIEELASAGVLRAGEGLKPTAEGWRVTFDGATRHARLGPFAPVAEQVAGFWIWQVRDMDEALEWARRCPNPMPGICEIELRPVYEAEDFGDALSPERAEREAELRREIEGR